MLTDFLYAYTYDSVNALEYRSLSKYRRFNIYSKDTENSNIRNIRETFDSINSAIEQELRDRRVEGQGQRNNPCLTGICPYESLHSKGSDKIYKKTPRGNTMNSGLILFRPIVALFGSTNVCY